MPKVSIIVPVYNVQNYVRECMDSILSQTLQDIEVICVNDGSTDLSPEILEEYAKQDSRIKILHKENTGYGASMNQGIKMASGEYIGVVEPDDYVEPKMYEKLYQEADRFQLDWVKCNFQVFTGTGKEKRNGSVKVYLPRKPELYHEVINPQEYPELIIYDDFHWKGIYRKEFLSRNHIAFNETPGAAYQDNGFKYQTTCMAERVMFIEETYYWYRRDNPSASTYNTKGLEIMYGEYQFIKDFMNRNQERTRVFWTSYYRKLYVQFQDQLDKILTKEWEEGQPEKILEKYRTELVSGLERGYLAIGKIDEWVYFEIRFFIRSPHYYFEYRKLQKEVEKERNAEWFGRLKDRKVVLVCGGLKARQMINLFDSNHFNCIVAVCDNNEKKWGEMLYGFSISSVQQAVEAYPEGYFIIAKAGETKELREQLLDLGVQDENIGNVFGGITSFASLRCIV